MSKDLNKVTLIGRLGQDLEIRYTASGTAVINCTLATTSKWKDGEHTEWHRLVFWEKAAEILSQYCSKGSKLWIEGELRTRSYEKDGITRYVTEIRVMDFIMLDSKGEAPARSTHGEPPEQRPAEQQQPPAIDDGFDDIPF